MTFSDTWFPPSGGAAPGIGRCVLVVDDEEVVRRVAHRYLTGAGYRVFESASPGETLAVLEETRVDLVLMDVVMPAPDGVALAGLIRRRWPDQRILFMSAYSDRVLLERGVGEWQRDLLIKPFTRDELIAAVEQALAPPERPQPASPD